MKRELGSGGSCSVRLNSTRLRPRADTVENSRPILSLKNSRPIPSILRPHRRRGEAVFGCDILNLVAGYMPTSSRDLLKLPDFSPSNEKFSSDSFLVLNKYTPPVNHGLPARPLQGIFSCFLLRDFALGSGGCSSPKELMAALLFPPL